MEIYVADITFLKDEKVFLSMQEKVPGERRRGIDRCRQKGDKQRSLGAGLLLEYGLNRLGVTLLPGLAFEQVFLETEKNGKPYLVGRKDICFNLSHSGNYVVAAFDTAPVGIDIEEIKSDGKKIAERFFCPEEKAFLEEKCHENSRKQKFTELWTRKESYIKAVGEGMRIPLDSFSVLEDRMRMDEDFYFRTFSMPEGYVLSVCAKTPIEVKPQFVSKKDRGFDGAL